MTNTTSRSLYNVTEYYQYGSSDDYEYSEFVYQAFAFEHPIYLFVWEILVVISGVLSTLFILTLMRKKLRSVTSYIFCAIAISDILTGLVTLPTYIMVYQQLSKADDYVPSEDYMGVNNTVPSWDNMGVNNTVSTNTPATATDAYLISDLLCDAFMITKFFWSKLFHTISIWLTVFLGTQRCLTVWRPFSARAWFTKKTIIAVMVSIVVLAPALHAFHIFNDKKKQGFCKWTNAEDCSDGTCIQLLVTLVLRHLIPCTVLTVTTVLMIRKLVKSSFLATRANSAKKFQHGSEVSDDENRQVTRIVLAIVIVFLITEVPYGFFLFYTAFVENHATYSFKTNRAIHVIYEITMVLSFNANLVIYTSFNRRFKSELKKVLCCCRGKPVTQRQTSAQTASTSHTQPGTQISTIVNSA